MYRCRLEGWEGICPEKPAGRMTPLEAALADRRAGESWYAMRHMEFVDLVSYHDVGYLQGGGAPSYDRIVESVVNLTDLVNRLMGGNISDRPNAIRKKAFLVTAPCLDLTARMPDYHVDPRRTTADVTDELARAFEDCIRRYEDGT
jgi:hypothetical protein